MTTETARRDILAQLVDDPRRRIAQARLEGAARRGELGVAAYLVSHDLDRAPSPLDVADLAATFRRSAVEAAARLGMLSRPQLVLTAWCYAAYLSELHGRDVDAETVLTNFDRGLAQHGVEVR
jgi:hypothetical protein